jgi:hypothetical protein
LNDPVMAVVVIDILGGIIAGSFIFGLFNYIKEITEIRFRHRQHLDMEVQRLNNDYTNWKTRALIAEEKLEIIKKQKSDIIEIVNLIENQLKDLMLPGDARAARVAESKPAKGRVPTKTVPDSTGQPSSWGAEHDWGGPP